MGAPSYAPRTISRLEDLERMVALQQQEAARLQSLIYSERAALAHQRQMEMHLRQQGQYYPVTQTASYMPVHHHPHHQQYPSYMHSSPFVAHAHPSSQTTIPQFYPVDSWTHFGPHDSERLDAYEDPQRHHVRSRSRERRIAEEMEVVDRPRRSSSRSSRALSPPTNASRFEAEVSSVSRRSTGGFSTRSSSAPRSPPRSRSQSRSRKMVETGGATIDPESDESKKARERQKKQNIIELEAAKQERKSETARRKKQAFNAEMTEYFRSKALKTPEVAYSRRFDNIKEWKQSYLEAKAEAGAEERRAASPLLPPAAADAESSYTGTATEELDRLFNQPSARRTLSPPRASLAPAAEQSFDRLRRTQSLVHGLAPEDAARVLTRSSNGRETFERFDDVSEQSSVVDTNRSGRISGGLRATSPARARATSPRAMPERQSASATSFEQRAASPVSPTPRQQYARIRHRMQGEDASGLQTRDLFANMSLQSSVGDYDDDDISEALHFPPPPRASQRRQQPQRSLSDYTPSPSKLQQYLEAAKLQSPMHASFSAGLATPPTLHRYATLV